MPLIPSGIFAWYIGFVLRRYGEKNKNAEIMS